MYIHTKFFTLIIILASFMALPAVGASASSATAAVTMSTGAPVGRSSESVPVAMSGISAARLNGLKHKLRISRAKQLIAAFATAIETGDPVERQKVADDISALMGYEDEQEIVELLATEGYAATYKQFISQDCQSSTAGTITSSSSTANAQAGTRPIAQLGNKQLVVDNVALAQMDEIGGHYFSNNEFSDADCTYYEKTLDAIEKENNEMAITLASTFARTGSRKTGQGAKPTHQQNKTMVKRGFAFRKDNCIKRLKETVTQGYACSCAYIIDQLKDAVRYCYRMIHRDELKRGTLNDLMIQQYADDDVVGILATPYDDTLTTYLHAAAQNGFSAIVTMLLAEGVYSMPRNKAGQTPKELAVAKLDQLRKQNATDTVQKEYLGMIRELQEYENDHSKQELLMASAMAELERIVVAYKVSDKKGKKSKKKTKGPTSGFAAAKESAATKASDARLADGSADEETTTTTSAAPASAHNVKAALAQATQQSMQHQQGGWITVFGRVRFAIGSRVIGDRWYTLHASERMAPDTPAIRKKLEERAIALGYAKGTADFTKYVDPRGVTAKEIEAVIAATDPDGHAGCSIHQANGLRVVLNNQGDVVTVVRI